MMWLTNYYLTFSNFQILNTNIIAVDDEAKPGHNRRLLLGGQAHVLASSKDHNLDDTDDTEDGDTDKMIINTTVN